MEFILREVQLLILVRHIYGTEAGVGIKSGTLNIDGATVVCDGEDKTPPLGYSNGINPSGVAIQIESNSDYAGNIKLNISSGTFKSKNSNVIYEYVGKKNGNSSIYSVSISGGKYLSEVGKEVFVFLEVFKSNHSGFLSGGKYSSNPSGYLKSGYNVVRENDEYCVVKNTFKESLDSHVIINNNNLGSFGIFGSIMVIIIIFGILGYVMRKKYLKYLINN